MGILTNMILSILLTLFCCGFIVWSFVHKRGLMLDRLLLILIFVAIFVIYLTFAYKDYVIQSVTNDVVKTMANMIQTSKKNVFEQKNNATNTNPTFSDDKSEPLSPESGTNLEMVPSHSVDIENVPHHQQTSTASVIDCIFEDMVLDGDDDQNDINNNDDGMDTIHEHNVEDEDKSN